MQDARNSTYISGSKESAVRREGQSQHHTFIILDFRVDPHRSTGGLGENYLLCVRSEGDSFFMSGDSGRCTRVNTARTASWMAFETA